MKIVKAIYGPKDVTQHIASIFKNESLNIYVSNDIFGDTNHGVLKKLIVEFDDGSKLEANENEFLIYPKIFDERIGIFYTNNNDTRKEKALYASLKSLAISSEKKARIITSVWNKIPENPFCEIISQTKNSNHLNQVLQILHLLYFVRKNSTNVKYVSFLEHDCLYPEEYFEYDDFECDSISNINYIGLCSSGWQPKNGAARATSQVTMKFTSAIKHFENILPNALLKNSGSLEPWYSKENGFTLLNWKNKDWFCKNPSVHINHGYAFTSHFQTFQKVFSESNEYWGDYSEYAYLFS